MAAIVKTPVQPGRRSALTLTAPVVIEIVDDELPGGRRNRMHLTVWIADSHEDVSQPLAARALAIGFSERALESLRGQPASSFE